MLPIIFSNMSDVTTEGQMFVHKLINALQLSDINGK